MKAKRLAALMLAGAMAVSTFGAGSVYAGDGAETGSTAIDFSEEPYELVLECISLGFDNPDTEMVEEAVNEITVPAVNVKVKIQFVTPQDQATKLSLMAAGGDKLDIVTCGLYPLTNMVSDRLLYPLNELLEERGQDIMGNERYTRVLPKMTVGEEIYAVPAAEDYSSRWGIVYNADLVEEMGVEMPEELTLETLEELAVKVKEYNPDMYLLAFDGSTEDAYKYAPFFEMLYPQYESPVDDFKYGVYDNTQDDLTLVNPYKTQEYRDYLSLVRKWYDNGWTPQDAATSGISGSDYVLTGSALCFYANVSPLTPGMLAGMYNFGLGISTYGDVKIGSPVRGLGIFANCERPDKAMDFLNYLYSHPDLGNLLFRGIEGVHYEKVSEHIIAYPEGKDASNVGYSQLFTYMGDYGTLYQFEPTTEEVLEECRELDANGIFTETYGFTFDGTEMSTQISNISNVLQEFIPSFNYGLIPEEKIDSELARMNEALDAAGIEELIAEVQRQLDEWMAEKK